MRQIDFVVIHTSGSYDYKAKAVVYPTIASIRAYHISHNGWRDVGYHWVVEEDGKGQRGRADGDVGAHVGGFNEHSLGLCVSGHGDFAPFNDAQWTEALRKCAQWCELYRVPVRNVIGHREAGEHGAPPVSKTCPGVKVDLDRFRLELGKRLGESGAKIV